MKINKTLQAHLLLIFVALIFETLICNFRTYQSLLYQQKDISEYPVQIDFAHFLPDGDLYIDGDSAFISIVVGDEMIRDLYVDLEVTDADPDLYAELDVCDLKIYIQDELLYGGEKSFRQLTERKVLHSLPQSQYIFYKSFGNTRILQLEICPQNGRTIRVHNIKLNAPRPMFFSFYRFLVFFLLAEAFFLFRPASWVWKRPAVSSGKRGMVLSCSIYIAFMIAVLMLLQSNPLLRTTAFDPYAELAKAFSNGNVSVGEISNEMAVYEDQLVSWGQEDKRIMFDYALYQGKYYVYFGALPAILFYLPYYLGTGKDLPDVVVLYILLAILVPGVYLLIQEGIKRFWREIPYALHMLFSMTFIIGSGVLALVFEPRVYHVAVVSGLVLIVWGMYFWLRAIPFTDHLLCLLSGSICMALVAACRPTFLAYSLLIVPMCVISYKHMKNVKMGCRKLWQVIAAICIPYAVVACGVMKYNDLRFGAPFQFGMIYNMTVIPSRNTAVDILELIPIAIYEYLLKAPEIGHLFPVIQGHYEGNVTEYSGTIYYYQTLGYGLFSMNPVLAILFAFPLLKYDRKKLYFKMFGVGIFFVIFMMCFDVYMTQFFATRYTLDYSLVIFLGAMAVWFSKWKKLSNCSEKKSIMQGITLIMLIPLFIQTLQIFIPKDYALNIGNTKLFYQFFYSWHFL